MAYKGQRKSCRLNLHSRQNNFFFGGGGGLKIIICSMWTVCSICTIFETIIDLIVNRPLIAHISLYTRLKPKCDRKNGIMGLVYIFNQWAFNCTARGPQFKPRWPLHLIFFHFLTLNKKMIEILTKIRAKITIIVVENREPYYFIIICKCKEVSLFLFSYLILASTFD